MHPTLFTLNLKHGLPNVPGGTPANLNGLLWYADAQKQSPNSGSYERIFC